MPRKSVAEAMCSVGSGVSEVHIGRLLGPLLPTYTCRRARSEALRASVVFFFFFMSGIAHGTGRQTAR